MDESSHYLVTFFCFLPFRRSEWQDYREQVQDRFVSHSSQDDPHEHSYPSLDIG
jgi:hypothetical protein